MNKKVNDCPTTDLKNRVWSLEVKNVRLAIREKILLQYMDKKVVHKATTVIFPQFSFVSY